VRLIDRVPSQRARTLDLNELFSVPSVGSFDVAKTGRIAFASNRSGQWQLYLGDLRSGILRASQFTDDPESKVSVRFSPDGERILYASDHQGDENFDLFVADSKTPAKAKNLTPNTNYAIYPSATFSKDGKNLAYVSNANGQFATYFLDMDSRLTKRVSHHKYSDNHAVFSPDGSKIALSSAVSGQDSGLFVLSLSEPGKRALPLSDPKTGKMIDASDQEWSPDGSSIVFDSSSKGSYDICLWNVLKNSITWLTDSKYEYYSPSFSHDGTKLAYTVNKDGDINLVIHDLTDGEGRTLEFRHGLVLGPKFTHDDKSIVFLFCGPRNPFDLWRYDLGDGSFTQLTNSLPKNLDLSKFVDGRQVYYRSKKDGMRIPAMLYMPKGLKRKKNLRAVIDIHGGPTAQSLNEWDPLDQYLITKGFVVLNPNYRGSIGYGRKFKEANRHVMGDLDLADCAAGRDYLVKQKIADPKKIAVMGGSFGGYLTMCALTKYPDYWSCGSALVPFLNWFTEIKNEREDLQFWDKQNMGDPIKDKKRLRDASPIFFLKRIEAPVQIIAGAHDPRCPLEESEQAKKTLERLGKEVETKFYRDEGHGFRKIKNRVDAYKRAAQFIEKHMP
jgi:dipeptidyl aminopeptidase/acylaminoacyl peptidase